VVWAGARGAVTLAAAQTLPESTPHRSLLVFVAFVVAAGSLLVQGGTLTLLVRWVKPTRADAGDTAEERDRLVGRLLAANREVLDRHADDPEMRAFRERLQQVERVEPDPRAAERVGVRLEMVEAQRAVLLAAREEGTFRSQLLTSLLDTLDAEPISIELRAEGAEPRAEGAFRRGATRCRRRGWSPWPPSGRCGPSAGSPPRARPTRRAGRGSGCRRCRGGRRSGPRARSRPPIRHTISACSPPTTWAFTPTTRSISCVDGSGWAAERSA